jgi:hypothetical protein
MTDKPFLLSVVATSRNDNHGKNLHYRMQHFVDGFVEQCKRHDLKAELILVEWNPPDNTLPLSQALQFPKDKGPCSIRIIRVPKETHMQLEHSDKIPLFQMIGKNVGIRRAKGEFVLATNIDILFSDDLMKYIKTRLRIGHLYRVDRLDIPEQLPKGASYDDIFSFCKKNVIRINSKIGTILIENKSFWKKTTKFFEKGALISYKFFVKPLAIKCARFDIKQILSTVYNMSIKQAVEDLYCFICNRYLVAVRVLKKCIKYFSYKVHLNNSLFPHTNACGDFTLLSSKDWENLKGYPEWNTFSWHLDSVLIYQARQHGVKETDLPRKMCIYHIEHEAGSGFSPESAHLLFERLDEKGIPYLSNSDLDGIVSQMQKSSEKVVYNDESWGMADLTLEALIV